MIKVLHYINKIKQDDLRTDVVLTLVSALRQGADVTLVTEDDDLGKVLEEQKPDIVHIHNCWSMKAYCAAMKAEKAGVATILSPHWDMEPYAWHHEHCITKGIKSMLYQYKMLHRVEAMEVTSEAEKDHLLQLGWNKRVGIIPSGVLDSTVTAEQEGQTAVALYKKVIDTRYSMLMPKAEREAFYVLVRAGAMRLNAFDKIDDKELLTLRELTPPQWRRLLLLADDEDVRPLVDSAIARLQLKAPQINTQEIDRFTPYHPKAKGVLRSDVYIGKAKSPLTRLKHITDNEPVIKSLVLMTLNAHYLMKHKKLSMRHVAELYQHIKYDEYDEDRYHEVMRGMGLDRFSRSMLQVLVDVMRLSEGFLPDKPKKGLTAKKIRKLL